MNKPFNDLLSPPSQSSLWETKEIKNALSEAEVAISELYRLSEENLENQRLENLLLLEAKWSSKIEDIHVSNDELIEGSTNLSKAAREVFRYKEATSRGLSMLERLPVGTRMAEQVCSTLKGVEMTVRKTSGTKLLNSQTGEVVYSPPEGEALLREKLAQWEDFLHNLHLPALVRIAASHKFFESIHPFTDGNGRTGRILINLSLVEEGLLSEPVLMIGHTLFRRRSGYYQKLSQNWRNWTLFMLQSMTVAARTTCDQFQTFEGFAKPKIAP